MPMTTMGLGGYGGWTPALIPGLRQSVVFAAMRQMGRLWQDTGETIPAVNHLDPIRRGRDPYLNIVFDAPSDAARPLLYDESGGKWSAQFDGVDDCLDCASVPFSAGQNEYAYGVLTRPSSVVGTRSLVEQAQSPNTTSRRGCLLQASKVLGFNG